MSEVPAAPLTVSRRRVLIGGAALALLSTTSAGCGTPAPRPEVDAFVAQLDRARTDGELAAGAATAARPPIAAALNTVAAERSAHAQALADEITRMTGDATLVTAKTTGPTTSGPTSTGASAQPPPPPTVKDVIAALEQSADGAAQLAARQSGYAAGLLGSISASCTAASTVALDGRQSS